MINEIFSYYFKEDGKIIKEKLVDHIKKAMEFTNRLEDSKIIRYVSKLCKHNDFMNLVKFSIIFHDVGKIFYQKNLVIKESQEFISFKGHEYFSTYIFEEFRNQLINQNIEDIKKYELQQASTFAILYHHHAMNTKLRYPKMNKKFQRSVYAGLSSLTSLKETLRPWLKKSEFNAFENVMDKIKSSSSKYIPISIQREVNEINKNLWKTYLIYPRFKKLCFLTLSTLLVADYLAAQKIRGVTKSQFKRVLTEFYNFYLVSSSFLT